MISNSLSSYQIVWSVVIGMCIGLGSLLLFYEEVGVTITIVLLSILFYESIGPKILDTKGGVARSPLFSDGKFVTKGTAIILSFTVMLAPIIIDALLFLDPVRNAFVDLFNLLDSRWKLGAILLLMWIPALVGFRLDPARRK